MNVFADFHHAGLLNSLILLFEKRLGGNLYRPIGMEWAEQGFWKVYDHPATQAQYLGIGGATPDGTQPLNEIAGYTGMNGFYHCQDIDSGQTNKAITLETFMLFDIDFVIATIPQHIEPFRRLCDAHPNHPKLIYQIGNAWSLELEQRQKLDAVLSSAKLPIIWDVAGYNGQPLPMIEYHQEFDLSLFSYTEPEAEKPGKTITSFVNCFSIDGLFQADWLLFQHVETLMADWSFYCFGGQCRDGAQHGAIQVAQAMRESRFVWHTKRGGDGYGHVIHNAFAMGRPPIVRFSDYDGKMARELMQDGVTAIDIGDLSAQGIVDKIAFFSEPSRYLSMSREAHRKFSKIVNFESEAVSIAKMLENLV